MTKQTAGILGSLTPAALRALTDAELDAKVAALEDTSDGDGYISTADEADLTLLHREQARRDEVPEPPPADGLTWFLVTCRSRTGNQGAVVLLVEARAGAQVEEEIARHGLDGMTHDISWAPLGDCVYGKSDPVASLIVVPFIQDVAR